MLEYAAQGAGHIFNGPLGEVVLPERGHEGMPLLNADGAKRQQDEG
jgi:hypothetical protein